MISLSAESLRPCSIRSQLANAGYSGERSCGQQPFQSLAAFSHRSLEKRRYDKIRYDSDSELLDRKKETFCLSKYRISFCSFFPCDSLFLICWFLNPTSLKAQSCDLNSVLVHFLETPLLKSMWTRGLHQSRRRKPFCCNRAGHSHGGEVDSSYVAAFVRPIEG